MRRRWVQWLIILIGIGLIVNLSRDVIRLLKVRDQVRLAQEARDQAKQENERLAAQKDYYTSDEFVEEEARNKLNMARKGEVIVILPEDLGQSEKKPPVRYAKPVYRQWWELFFSSRGGN